MSSGQQQSDDEEEHYIIYDYDAELQREWAAEREQEKLNTYRNAKQLHPSYVFNKDIDAHMENLKVESERLQDNVREIGNIISSLNLQNLTPTQISKQSKSKSKSKSKPINNNNKSKIGVQEQIDLQQKILSGSSDY